MDACNTALPPSNRQLKLVPAFLYSFYSALFKTDAPRAGLKGVQIGESLLYHLAISILQVCISKLFKCTSNFQMQQYCRDQLLY